MTTDSDIETELTVATNLQQLGAEVKRSKRPLLLLFTQQDCNYCHRLKEEIFRPMMRNIADRERVLIREVSIDMGQQLIDFDGNEAPGLLIFKEYKLVVTPTALLVDNHGKQLSKPMLGANTLEMYGWYLDAAIDEARGALQNA